MGHDVNWTPKSTPKMDHQMDPVEILKNTDQKPDPKPDPPLESPDGSLNQSFYSQKQPYFSIFQGSPFGGPIIPLG